MENSQAPSGDGAVETPNQRQARLRRERREAKLKVEGASRLEKISKVSGRQELHSPLPNIGKVSSDPDKVDLSTHSSASQRLNTQQQPSSTPGPSAEAEIRAMLRSGAPQPGIEVEGSTSGEDPMMKIFSQLMGGIPGNENGEGEASDGGIPPGLAAILRGGGMTGAGDVPSEQKQDSFGYLWRIFHVVIALCLGLYVTTTSMALNQSIERDRPGTVLQGPPKSERPTFLLIFVTVELVLQSTRFFLEKGNSGGSLEGWIGLIARFLPEPYRGYFLLVGGYARIWGTLVEDAMVIIFVIGCRAWWKGSAR